MKRDLIVTKDGSHTLLISDLGETFHSRHGAIQESLHVYIENGLKFINSSKIDVLEFGFGTGLNALLTYQYAKQNNITIKYETIEAYPLTFDEFKFLNYDAFIKSNITLHQLHHYPFNEIITIDDDFIFLKHHQKIQDFKTSNSFDIIYFDVFGYDYQPELWSEEILTKAYNLLNSNGVLVTYACKSIVTKTLKKIGFTVKKLPGAPGKREMTVAVK